MEQGPDELNDQTGNHAAADDARRESESGYQDGGTTDAQDPESLDDTAVQRPPSDS